MRTENCIFCDILEGKQPGEIVYRGRQVFVLLSIDSDSHPMIVTREHFEDWSDPRISHEVAQEAGVLELRLIGVVRDIYRVSGVAALSTNGVDSGQFIKHAHKHIIPCPPNKKTVIVKTHPFDPQLHRQYIANHLNQEMSKQEPTLS